MIYNVHERVYPIPASWLGELLDRIAGPDSPLWPVRRWPAMILDGPLDVGANGRHGPVRYRCTAYQPGRRVEFTFTWRLIKGTHTFHIRDGVRPDTCLLRHVVLGRPRGLGRVLWPVALRSLHNALLADLMDHAAESVGHPPAERARWSPWVRVLRGVLPRARHSVREVRQQHPAVAPGDATR
ncbi:MAG TPA: SRPBCC family protein [Actinophytocola sp.]|uniref:SRPBCC family protein n=1 Tax=Actinophytocola sp. TaxID=1872138 RepID=UPI002DBB6C84|nr:SRPBCC family protein [Actinophytocola sp.]HEU5474762.1 SRPBCC family protein [Actinophytocola sp.]